MKIPAESRYLGDAVDTRDGDYFVSVVDADRFQLLAGPFQFHIEALEQVERVTRLAHELDRNSIWYGFGTCRLESPSGRTGILNGRLEP